MKIWAALLGKTPEIFREDITIMTSIRRHRFPSGDVVRSLQANIAEGARGVQPHQVFPGAWRALDWKDGRLRQDPFQGIVIWVCLKIG